VEFKKMIIRKLGGVPASEVLTLSKMVEFGPREIIIRGMEQRNDRNEILSSMIRNTHEKELRPIIKDEKPGLHIRRSRKEKKEDHPQSKAEVSQGRSISLKGRQ